MARGVTIDSGPVEAGDLLRDVPQEKWRELMLARRRFLEIHISHDCRCLVQFVNDAKLMFEALGFASPEHMIREGYGLKPEEISVAVEWLQLNPPTEPIALDVVMKLGKHGGKRTKGEQGSGRTLKRGETRAYILARLDRDGHTELAAKVRANKLSAAEAARKAGIRKPAPTKIERALKLLPSLTRTELRHLRARIDELLGMQKGKRAA